MNQSFEAVRLDAQKNEYTNLDIIEIFSEVITDEYKGMSEEFIAGMVALTCAEYERYVVGIAQKRAENEAHRQEVKNKRIEQARLAREAKKAKQQGTTQQQGTGKIVTLGQLTAQDIRELVGKGFNNFLRAK